MDGGGTRVSLKPSGARRHKALAPWRFQIGFVRREIKSGDVSGEKGCGSEKPEMSRETVVGRGLSGSGSDGGIQIGFVRREIKSGDVSGEKGCGSEKPEMSRETVVGRGLSGSGSDGGSVDADFQSSPSYGSTEFSKGGGGGGTSGNCCMDGLSGDSAAKEGDSLPKDSNFCQGAENDGVEPAKPSNLQDFQCNGAAKEIDLAGKDCNSEGLKTGDGTVMGCRKGRKALVPWRFLNGNKRKWLQDSCSQNGSNGKTEDQTAKTKDGSRQYAPTVARHHSSVQVSAASKRPSVKIQKGTSSAPKKRKVDKDEHHQVKPNNRTTLFREKVLTTLQEFRIIYKTLLDEEEAKSRERGHDQPDVAAFNIYWERFCVNNDDRRYAGSIPGVRIGDVFNSIMELSILGIHRTQGPVDHISKKDGTCLAVSIVSCAQPSAFDKNLDFLLHVGSVAATSNQKIKGTDLALKESMDTDTPVRVIHKITEQGEDNQLKRLTTYVYGGLYSVEKFCREKTCTDRYVNTFHLRRLEGQQHIDIQEALKTRNPETFYGIFNGDISGGLEKIPISAINSISNEYPTAFCYISQIEYPLRYRPDLPSGCDCIGGCSVSQKCACAVKNGGEFPFNDLGLINEKPLIYECGPSCKCPPTCRNRVSQHGMKFRLQVFKTKSMGWGVRSLDFIPSGSFVCEYIGELLEDDDAQKRVNDEYLFGIGNNYYDDRWEGLWKTIPSLQSGPSEEEENGFAVDALKCGNLARFINHSCTPNLVAQNVLYDHDDISKPRVMFFAGEDILPLKDLSYDYNYKIDKVYDSDGNIKKKPCFCGSIECTGRLY
ncbi:hypothetical protein ACP70R_026538 [Stipagrostis hirtigluma subsp. patula]